MKLICDKVFPKFLIKHIISLVKNQNKIKCQNLLPLNNKLKIPKNGKNGKNSKLKNCK